MYILLCSEQLNIFMNMFALTEFFDGSWIYIFYYMHIHNCAYKDLLAPASEAKCTK